MWELYRRLPADDVVIVAGDHRNAQSFDATPRQREAAPLRTNVDKNDPLTGVAELLSQVRAAEGRVLGKRQ